jgi:hypothetical protein
LLAFLLDHVPSDVDEMSSQTTIDDVSDVEVEAVEVRRTGIHVRGRATLDVQLNFSGGNARDGLTLDERLPLTFDVDLDPALKLGTVHQIHVDTSEFYE